jgi:hypothetical protein
VVSFTARSLYPWYPLDRRLGGPGTGRDVERKQTLPLTGLELRTLGRPARAIYTRRYVQNIVIFKEQISFSVGIETHQRKGNEFYAKNLYGCTCFSYGIVTCRLVSVARMTGSTSDDWI